MAVQRTRKSRQSKDSRSRSSDLATTPSAKKISPQQIAGKQGAALFTARVLGVGLSFHETGALDAGVDGFIEMRDPDTGEVRAQFVASQIKTVQRLAGDTGETFSFRPEARDLDYWLQSNAPVILVVVHLASERIWWTSIQTYFSDPERRKDRKVVFNQEADLLAGDTVGKLADLVATFARPGLLVPSSRVEETLDLNLLQVLLPEHLYVAPTELSYREIRQALIRHREYPPRDWIEHDGFLVSFRDLDDPLFEDACDIGAVDRIDVREWWSSDGDVTERRFVNLLGRCLSERMGARLSFHRERRYLYFKADRHRGIERTIRYRSYQNQAQRKVVSAHGTGKDGKGAAYYRHQAFNPRFVRFGDDWYLAIEPTYHFTRDGFEEHPFGFERLKKVKLYETNSNVRGHIGMWRSVLTERGDLLSQEYPFLRFETVPGLVHPHGVDDELWMRREDPEELRAMAADPEEVGVGKEVAHGLAV